MDKFAYLDALKRAMAGLPHDVQAKTLAYYEQRFVDGVAAGRSEEDVARELDDPKKIAMTLRANAHMHAFEEKKNPANLLRVLMSAVGLAIFNLVMVAPAMVFAALLASVYACALAFYIAGIAITASGLAGANELVLSTPLRHFLVSDAGWPDDMMQTKVNIGETAIRVFQEKVTPPNADATVETPDVDPADEPNTNSARVIKRAEAVAGHGIHISTDVDGRSRTTQVFFGLGMVLAGIGMFLLSLVLTRYTMVGIRRYIDMNFSLLKGS